MDDVLAVFDHLESINQSFMMGRWKGFEITTGHPQDGVLEATRWYGKEFEDAETVHPLLHRNSRGQLFRVRPRPTLVYLSLRLPILKARALRPLSLLITAMLRTRHSQARIRMVEYRGKVSATMIYDGLPINDHFRKIDDNTVLGLMDFKGLEFPFPFVLERDDIQRDPR
jgi:hypothetical protein